MAFFDDLKSKAAELTQVGVAKSKQLAEIAKLNLANSGEEDAIRRRISEALHAEGHHYRTIITFDSEAFNDIHTRMEADVTEPPIPEEPSGARRE